MTIQGWMRTELGLKGNDLMIYAVIYGFSQTEKQWFTGSRQYLADWLGCSVRTVQNALDKMTADGLLQKRKGLRNGKVYCDYRADFESEKTALSESEKTALPKVKNLHYRKGKNCTSESEKISHHTKDIYISNNKAINIRTDARGISEEFQEIWSAYPKRTNRKQSEAEYRSIRAQGVDFNTVLDGVKSYAAYISANKTEPRYVKNLANWLRAEAWTDEYETVSCRDGYDISPDVVEELISGAF